MSKKKEETKTLIIPGQLGYRLVFDKNSYQISYDQCNEHNLASMAIVDSVLGEIIESIVKTNVYSDKEKKAKRDRLDRLRKLKLEIVNNMADIMSYLLETKNPEDYEPKPNIQVVKPGDENKLN